MTYTLRSLPSPASIVIAFLLGLIVAALGIGIIRDFSGPIIDGGDADQYSYTSYYFARNISFWPIPLLDLYNNQTFYPYGAHHVFLPWGFERDFFYTLLNRWPDAEYKPLLQLYFLYSLVIGAVGTFLLIHRRFGHIRAIITSLIVSVFTFYNLYKYPAHLNMAVVHWTVLCMIATFILLHDLYHSKRISLTFWLLWCWFHLAILGLELGYVAGYALTFTTISLPFIVFQLWQLNKAEKVNWLTLFSRWLLTSYYQERRAVWVLLLLSLITAWLYIPLCAQISIEALGYTFPSEEEFRAWSHPLRLFIPSLPGVDSHAIRYENYLHDTTFESYAQTSPGLYMVILGAVGLWQIRKKTGIWTPIVVMLILCLLYHPIIFPTLKIFPWFAFNRHAGRASMVYPALLCMLALQVRWPQKRHWQLALAGVLCLMLAEWDHGYNYRRTEAVPVIPPTLFAYLQTVRDTPGQAVLDWPFCSQGADCETNKDGLCPYYEAQNAINTLRRFHHKAVVGQYVGRLHPDLVKPLINDQWPRLLTPGYQFTNTDWTRLDRFLRKNKFVGINLYPDLLTPTQTQAFLAHYGPPIAVTTYPMAGKLLFLPLR